MTDALKGLKVAILVADGFEQIEMVEPRKALEQAGAHVDLISPNHDKVQGWNHDIKANTFQIDVTLNSAHVDEYAALMLPGGVINPDTLRLIPRAIEFIKHFVSAKKPIAAICHGAWTLIDAEGVKGRKMTSWPSLKTDLTNAGAIWADEPCVHDKNLVTSRNPKDLPVFNTTMIEVFAKALK